MWWWIKNVGKLDAGMEREFKFHPKRRWRFDFAWPEKRVAVEIEGVVFGPRVGRHQRGRGMINDCEKYAEALVLGWRVLRVVPDQVKSGAAGRWLEAVLRG